MSYKHGITVNEPVTGARAIATASSAVIGIVATATDADANTFPLNEAVLITDVRKAIGKAGVVGSLAKALACIADQCSPKVVVVRVAPGVDLGATETNIIGTTTAQGQLTGMKALLAAKAQLGVKPTILGVPGYDSQAVVTALVPIAKKLRGMVYAKGVGSAATDVTIYRENFSARELMLIWPDFTDWDGSAVARALGTRAAIDATTGWHKTLSNTPVQGVTGLTKDIDFDMLSNDTIAGLLNDADVTTLIRNNGFRYWGNRTCSDDPIFAFESAVRTSHVLQETIADGLTWAIDKPLTPQLVKDILETINNKFRGLVRAGYLIGAKAWFDPSLNSATDLAGGKLVIDYDYTPCAPAEALTLNQRITDKYYADFAKQLDALG